LSERSGIRISQADVIRLENENGNPCLNLLKRPVAAMNLTLKIEFIPNGKSQHTGMLTLLFDNL
jgi:hypothetical protein